MQETIPMTNLGDVVRQLETVLCDPGYPPTPHEREVYDAILQAVCTGATDTEGSQ